MVMEPIQWDGPKIPFTCSKKADSHSKGCDNLLIGYILSQETQGRDLNEDLPVSTDLNRAMLKSEANRRVKIGNCALNSLCENDRNSCGADLEEVASASASLL